MKSNLSSFSFAARAFGIISKSPLPNPRSPRFTTLFSSKRFMTEFCINFCIACQVWVLLHSFACGNRPVEETSLSPLNELGTLVENQFTIDVWVYF